MAQLKDTVVSGSLRATDTLYSTTAQFQILRAPTSSNGTTYGPGTSGQILKSNGTSVYWASDNDSHYTTHMYVNATAGGTTNNTDTANTTTYLHLYDNTTKRETVQIKGSGTTTVSSSGGVITINSADSKTGTVTSVQVQATSPITSSVNTAQTGTLNTTIALADNYGDTKNPYASKTKNYVLAASATTNSVPSFRALVASDIPELSTEKLTSGTLTIARGGTGISTYTIGDILYSNAVNSLSKLSGNTTTTRKFLRSVATTSGTAVAPAWDTVTKTDVGLSNVENTALSTWAGTNKITTVGTISTGTWQGTAIAASYIGNHSTDKLTSGTLPVGRGGTGQTSIANIQAGKDGNGNTISSTYLKLSGGTLTGDLTIKTSGSSSNTSLDIQTNKNNGGIELRADHEGGNLKITGPDGNSFFEIDAVNNTHLRVYSYSDFSNTSTYKTINWDRTSGNLLNNDGTILAGNTTLAKEIQLRARSAAGEIYLFTQGSATGAKGLYSYNAPGTSGGGILVVNQSNQISSLADISANINVVNGGIIIGTMADTVQRSINIRSKTGRIALYTGTSSKGLYATSAPTTDAPDGVGKNIIGINNDNDVDSLAYFKVPVQIKSLHNYAPTPSSDLTTDLIQMYDSNLGIYHRIYSARGTGGTKTLFMMTREPGSELKTYVQFGVRLNSDGSPGFSLSAKYNGTSTNSAAQTSFRNLLGASSGIWPISLGGTEATTAAGARSNLGAVYYINLENKTKAATYTALSAMTNNTTAVIHIDHNTMNNLAGKNYFSGTSSYNGLVSRRTNVYNFLIHQVIGTIVTFRISNFTSGTTGSIDYFYKFNYDTRLDTNASG